MQKLTQHLHLTELSGIEYRVARTKEELEKAYSLVYREYIKKAYMNENCSGLRFSIYNALPLTTTFVAITESGDIIATATVIPDSPLGLPMDEICEKELSGFRTQGRKLCEISMLASDTEFLKHAPLSLPLRKIFPLFLLFKALLDYARESLSLDIMCITINPKYKTIFNFLAFRDMGGIKPYPEVNGAPALGLYVDMHTLSQDLSAPGKEKLYDIFILNKTNPACFAQKMFLALEDIKYFFLEKSSIFTSLPCAQREYIKHCYPALV